MKLFIFAGLLLACLLLPARAQSDADDKYIGIYNLIQRAGQLVENGTADEAYAALSDAQTHLLLFKKTYPNWNPNIVSFRLNQLADSLAELKGRLPAPKETVKASETVKVIEAPVKPSAATTGPSPVPAELNTLRAQLQAERDANEKLQAKLKEALSVRPSATDPAELERAREQIRSLMKQNDLLMASRPKVAANPPQKVYVTNLVQVFVTNTASVTVTNLVDAFKKEPATVVITNFIRTVVVDTNAVEMLRLERAAAVKNFNDEHKRAEQLANELKRLQKLSPPAKALQPSGKDASELSALRAENATLKAELARLQTAAPLPRTGETNLFAELTQARARIALLQDEAQIAALEKMALQNKLQSLLAATNPSAGAAAYEARIRELTLERNNLIEKLDTTSKLNSGKNGEAVARVSDLTREVTLLRARLAAAEAQAVPYSAEELALFQTNMVPTANPQAAKKSIHEMPAGTAALVYSAQEHFAKREFDKAEADYQKILSRDENNGMALANLAVIEMQANRLDEAEKHIKAAIAQNPDDPYNLSTLGSLKFRQGKYEEALTSLSRAAQLEPNNPEVQNFLGLTFGHLGQRKPAETAFRKSLEIDPKYAPAHENLAVIYLTQTPTAPALARWHYQKALEAGEERKPEIEKLLAEKGAPVQ
jgi:Flp pilus assembly protein TadD